MERVMADITSNFRFYVYGTGQNLMPETYSAKVKQIDGEYYIVFECIMPSMWDAWNATFQDFSKIDPLLYDAYFKIENNPYAWKRVKPTVEPNNATRTIVYKIKIDSTFIGLKLVDLQYYNDSTNGRFGFEVTYDWKGNKHVTTVYIEKSYAPVVQDSWFNQPPSLTVNSPSTNQIVSGVTGRRTITISGTVTDINNDTVTISATVNGKTKSTSVAASSTAKSWSLTWDVVSDAISQGSYSNIVVTADDGSGGVSTAKYTGTIIVDKIAPVITLSGVSEGQSYPNSVSPTFSATDAGGSGLDKVTATLNGAAYTSGTAITSSGAKTLVVTAVDRAGNQSQKTVNFVVNSPPTLSLQTANNHVLTEENTLPITGSTTDLDSGNVVTVKYKINNGSERNLDSRVSDGSSPILFSKALVYRGGRLYDGTTDVSGLLAEGTTHTLSVWATDDKGGSSPIATRSFTVKYNKAPIVTVDEFTPVQSGLIPADSLSLSGTASDPDGNTVTVKGKLNTGTEKTLLSGVSSGNWSFPFKVSELKSGANTITITATDQFGAATVKNFNVKNEVVEKPMKQGVARYKIIPPLGSAKEILAWQKREKGDLVIDAEASFVDAGQPEQYVAMTRDSVDLNTEIAEDQLYGMAAAPKADVVFKETLTRTNSNSTAAATMLVGVFK